MIAEGTAQKEWEQGNLVKLKIEHKNWEEDLGLILSRCPYGLKKYEEELVPSLSYPCTLPPNCPV